MRTLLIFLSLCCFTPRLNSIVILVHGSFANQETWHQPEGDFFDELEKQARTLHHKTISFCWPGMPTTATIVASGQTLAKLILSYPPTEQIIVIGHSHGGNVISIASQLLSTAATNTFDADFLLSLTPTTRKHEPTIFELFCKALPQIKKLFHLYQQQWRNISTFAIQAAYFLGTPIDAQAFMPSMNAIEYVYNFYSQGDIIQPVLGFFQRTLPTHERITNLSITIKNTGILPSDQPSHSQLHLPIVARWLLSIPHQLKQQKIGNFENFEHTNGHIHIDPERGPMYTK
ncbi:alpha/beta fold hydrolase [Candidatus Babeliales bacterium]|nr:alpha/beta fold hydrolase [Candidatus Babeliales bacterium]